jgi:hypothetical protein
MVKDYFNCNLHALYSFVGGLAKEAKVIHPLFFQLLSSQL